MFSSFLRGTKTMYGFFGPSWVLTTILWYGMVWYGMVWCGMVWYGVVWYGMVWYGIVWYRVVWYGMVWYGTVWYGMVWHGMVLCGMVWYGTVWCGVVWCGVVWPPVIGIRLSVCGVFSMSCVLHGRALPSIPGILRGTRVPNLIGSGIPGLGYLCIRVPPNAYQVFIPV